MCPADESDRRGAPVEPRGTAPTATGADWEVHDADNGSTLPGRLVRTAGEPEVGDLAVDEAATGLTESLALFTDFGRDSYDDRGATVVATVHYEREYDNAFWDGTQLVFGDGDGRVFDRFTKPIDVLGHELAHAVTQFTADLTYEGQSGALNESMSDVFGACIKQRHLGQDAAAADWLIGEGIFLPGINGRALRSMSEPGTAYDDPLVGKDPQVGSMADYVRHPRRQRWCAPQQRHPQPCVRDRGARDRRRVVEAGRTDLVRRTHLRARRGQRLRHVRCRDDRGSR